MPTMTNITSDLAGTIAAAGVGGLDSARTVPPIALAAAGPALNTSITATSLLLAGAKATLPPGYETVGKILRLTATGVMSCIVTTPGTFTPDVRFNGLVVFNGGPVALNVVAKVNVTFRLDVLLTCQVVGAGTAAKILGVGVLNSEAVVGAAAGTAISAALPATAPAQGAGFDSTITNTVDLFGTFSISNIGNAIQVLEYALDPVN